jgi:membrane associated rhomboid family serine protease
VIGDPVLVGLIAAGLAALVLQVSDAIFALIDAATVRDSDEPDALTKRRGRELFWAVAVTATLAVLVAYAVDRAARLAWGAGVGVLLITALATFVVGCVGALVVLRRERPTYARLRRDLRDRSTFTVDADELSDFVLRLERADRVRSRRPTATLALRILGVLLVVTAAALVVVDAPAVLPAAITAVAAHLVAFVVALRASAVHRDRLEAVLDAQRDEVVAMLERARIPQRGRVPGLRDRVSRALAILREQQR